MNFGRITKGANVTHLIRVREKAEYAQGTLDFGRGIFWASCKCFALYVAESGAKAYRGEYNRVIAHSPGCLEWEKALVWQEDVSGELYDRLLFAPSGAVPAYASDALRLRVPALKDGQG